MSKKLVFLVIIGFILIIIFSTVPLVDLAWFNIKRGRNEFETVFHAVEAMIRWRIFNQ